MNKREQQYVALAVILSAIALGAYVYLYPESISSLTLGTASWEEVAYTPEMLAVYTLGGLLVVVAVIHRKKPEKTKKKD